MNALTKLSEYGQSVWMDYIRRSLIGTGELQRLIDEDGLRGLTSNPSIFEKAISGSSDYDEALDSLAERRDLDAKSMYEHLAIDDIQRAADIIRPMYDESDGRDGLVSLEVAPDLANDTQGTIEEAHRLWKSLDRDNVMIKVPATEAGVPAIERLIADGLNINVTLLFSRSMYERVVEAYLSGLEMLREGGGDVSEAASVASFFVSRVDAAVDDIIEQRQQEGMDPARRSRHLDLQGKVAIANAKLAYQQYQELFSGERWETLRDAGARTQRLLWASTSTKNPKFPETLYVDELIGPETVTTLPPATMDAFRENGNPGRSLDSDLEGARATLETLEKLDISLDDITDRLLHEGVRKFADSFEDLLEAVEQNCRAPGNGEIGRQTYSLPKVLADEVDETLKAWSAEGKARRLWARDASLWTDGDEARWLGWLGVTEDQLSNHLERFQRIADFIKRENFSHIVLLGMGGSSLCPEVLASTFGPIRGFPELHVLDSTDPGQVRSVEEKIDLERTLFITSSKSGTTLETNIFRAHFYERVKQRLGEGGAGRQFIAITDPGSELEAIAERDGFHRVFYGVPSIGGRYSALSDFGLVPAAAMGLDVGRLLGRADEMVQACASCVPVQHNPGAVLGVILGVAGRSGRDKVTLITSPIVRNLGAWLEQLLAESTGKQGIALIPVDGERLGEPDVYGEDRLFVYLGLAGETDSEQEAAMERLESAGQPVVRIELTDRYDLGQEFFRWEFATAVAGSVLGINPFNQPDVEASKVATRKLTDEYEKKGELPRENAIVEDDRIQLLADPGNAAALADGLDGAASVGAYLRAHLDRLQPGDYFGLLAYLERNDAHDGALQALRHRVRDARRVATCLGYGPRFLHSTGQAYKGGPNTGVFLQITCDAPGDLPVPDRDYTFGVVKDAQARGDFQVLAERGRRALRVHLGRDIEAGLKHLADLIDRALA